jgi:transcriptional regulator with XRE-family HTH domain
MNPKDTNVCARLGEERKRLHLSQNTVAEYCGVSVKTIGRWEKNIPVPSDKLALLHDLGYDYGYILTGLKQASNIADLGAASSIWNRTTPGTENQTEIQGNQNISTDQKIWLDLLENLAGGDHKRLQQIGLALVGYSQAKTEK